MLPNDWISFDQRDEMNCFRSRDFDSIFVCVANNQFKRKSHVLAKRMECRFSAYREALRLKGNAGDYLVQEVVHPFHQTVCSKEKFECDYSPQSTDIPDTTCEQSSPELFEPRDVSIVRYSVWGPSLGGKGKGSGDVDDSLHEYEVEEVSAEDRVTRTLTEADSMLCRQHSSSLLAFKLLESTTVWKRVSGQGGRSYGEKGDLIVFHVGGDCEGIFPRDEFIRHFRCNEVDVGISDSRLSDATDAYTQCSDVESVAERPCFSRVYDVRAVKMLQPFVAYTDSGDIQYGNSGDYLVQALLPRCIMLHQEETVEGQDLIELEEIVAGTDDGSLTEIRISEDRKTEVMSHPTKTLVESARTYVDSLVPCQWVVTGSQFNVQYFPVEVVDDGRHRQSSAVSDLTVADHLDAFRIEHSEVANIFARPFEVYSSTVLCWEGVLRKRTKLLRQWQTKQCQIYPDKIVFGHDVDGSSKALFRGDSLKLGNTEPPSPKYRGHYVVESGPHICLKTVSLHQTTIDDKPVIYLGNARLNDEDSTPRPLEPFHVTSDSKRWESRYSKWFSVRPVGSLGLQTAPSNPQIDRESMLSKGASHMSFSNKNGIFLQTVDMATHHAVVALLESCILFCRREMAFAAAVEGNCEKTLEVLLSVSPNDACKIVSSPRDQTGGRLLQHEAARMSLDLLREIYQFYECNDEMPRDHSRVSLSSITDGGFHPQESFLTVGPETTCALGLNCLHYAVQASNLEVLAFILSKDFHDMGVHSTTLSGQTPLHFASTSKIVSYLLERGSNPVALDFEGNTPVMMMTSRGAFPAVSALMRDDSSKGIININTQSWKTGLTALMIAICRLSKASDDYSDVLILVELLLHYGADPDICDIQKNTCLHCVCSIFRACCSDTSQNPSRQQLTQHVIAACVKIMKILVDYGSNKKAINDKGHIPFTIISQAKNYSVDAATVTAVLDTVIFGKKTVSAADSADASDDLSGDGGDEDADDILNFRTESGASGLHLAVEAVNPDILRYLLEKGIDANCTDSRGFTPLDVLKAKQVRAGAGMVERQAADLLVCLNILYQHGAVRRLRADLPVEQDSEHITFSRLQCGRYQVKSATLDAMVKRVCNDQLYCDDDARALVLVHRKVCTDEELLSKIVEEFQIQIESVRQSRNSAYDRDTLVDSNVIVNDEYDLLELPNNVPLLAAADSSMISVEIEERARTVSFASDLPNSGSCGLNREQIVMSEVQDPNDLEDILNHRDSMQDSEILRPSGILSTVMMWCNMMEDQLENASDDFFALARQIANMALRNCPEELSRESIALLNMGLSKRGMNQHIIRGLASIYTSRVAKQRSVRSQDADVRRAIEASQLDEMLEAAALGSNYKQEFIDSLMGSSSASRLASIKPIELAQQVTLMQHHLFSKIPPSELLSIKYRDDEICPNLKAMRDWNSDVTNFLINEILFASNVSERADFISFLITTAFISINLMNNFDFAVIILGVLECTAIYRLKATWEKVEKLIPGKRAEFKKLVGIAGRNVSALMSKCLPPMVPYLGLYLQKLINLHEVPSQLDCGHLNISKYRGIAHILFSYQEAQKVDFKIDIDMTLQVLLISPVMFTTEEEFIGRSRELEPPIARN